MTAASNSEARKRATDHQPVAVLSIDGMPFVKCSCTDEIKPQSSVWLQDHWQGSEESGIEALQAVVAQQRAQAAQKPVSSPIPAPVDSGAIWRLSAAECREIVSASIARERMLGGPPVDVLLHAVERIVREHTDRALAEVEQRIEVAWDEGWTRGAKDMSETVHWGETNCKRPTNPYRAARQEQGRG